MNTFSRSSRVLITTGYMAMLVGAIDPMEGSLLILPGSGLVVLGTFLGRLEKQLLIFRLSVLLLIAFGVAALFGLTVAGGVGATTGLSIWWGTLILPYLIGWSIGSFAAPMTLPHRAVASG